MTGRNLEDDEDALLLCLVDEDPLLLDLVLDLDDDLFSFARSFFSAASFKTAGQSHCPITHLFKTMIPVVPSSFGRLSLPDTCPIHFCHLEWGMIITKVNAKLCVDRKLCMMSSQYTIYLKHLRPQLGFLFASAPWSGNVTSNIVITIVTTIEGKLQPQHLIIFARSPISRFIWTIHSEKWTKTRILCITR